MKTLEELKAFAEGYRYGLSELPNTDDWIVWGGYDINFVGAEYAQDITDGDIAVYTYTWKDGNLSDPIHAFVV